LKTGWDITIDREAKVCMAKIYKLIEGKDYHQIFRCTDPNELRAFALAVWAMKKG